MARTSSDDTDSDRPGEERRERGERRRSAKGLFELRARREGSGADRRQQSERRALAMRPWKALLRRFKSE